MSSKGKRNTGYEYSVFNPDADHLFSRPSGGHETRHEAVGHAAILGRLLDEDFQVTWHESMWRERDEPVVCGYCGFEEWYMPLVRWTFVAGADASPFCSTECYARWSWENDRERFIEVAEPCEGGEP